LYSDKNKLEKAIPGGLIGVQLDIDPAFTLENGLAGHIMVLDSDTNSKSDISVFEAFELEFTLIKELAGNDSELKDGDVIVLNCNASNVKCVIFKIKKQKLQLRAIKTPVCASVGEIMTISKEKNEMGIQILGTGKITRGFSSKMVLFD
jgi:translation initiation factor 2 subunit 3